MDHAWRIQYAHIHPLSRTDEHIEDEHVPYIQSLHFLLTDAPFMDEARHTFNTLSVAPSSIGVIHGKGQLSGIFFFFYVPRVTI